MVRVVRRAIGSETDMTLKITVQSLELCSQVTKEMGHHFMNGDVDLSSNNQAEAGANNLNGEGGEWSEQDPMDCGESSD